MATSDKPIFDKEQRENLTEQLADLPVAIKFVVKGEHSKEETKALSDFARAYAKLAPGFSVKVENTPTEQDAPVVELWVDGDPSGVSFCGVPSGKELDSFTTVVLNAGGKGENMPDEMLRRRIEKLEGPAYLFTFVSKGCPGCPDVVEAMNVVSLLNHRFKNMTVDIDAAPDFAKEYGVKSVPAVFANGELLSLGHASLGQLVADLEKRFGS
ncbi:MAG: thioredoxin family protein, partial [Muribaculaceae bacterium]|nr:thioredoxin family protein [Muribaculaceae bacterium]